ncbi:MAG TPA: sugar phosphate isomerase/epimerase family protein [Lacunisphaera sp.]|nr:sugar phosphate isomerase/epimerase family protein [Lacunisphaera sp.]
MTLLLFTKRLAGWSIDELVAGAHRLGLAGYDLAVREGHLVNPDNVGTALADLVRVMRSNGLAVPMVSARADLVSYQEGDAKMLLRAMAASDVRLLKIGYFRFPRSPTFNYRLKVEACRRLLAEWETAGREHGVKICYHTHSTTTGDYFLGSSVASLLDLFEGLDPAWIGAYLDSGHLAMEGEPIDLALAMASSHLCAMALKDMRSERGTSYLPAQNRLVPAGAGAVDWAAMARSLARVGFRGPLSIHAEYEPGPGPGLEEMLAHEVGFFRQLLEPHFAPAEQGLNRR